MNRLFLQGCSKCLGGGGTGRKAVFPDVKSGYSTGVGGISVPQENLSPGQFFLGNDVRGTMYPRMICPPPGWIVPLEKVSGVLKNSQE